MPGGLSKRKKVGEPCGAAGRGYHGLVQLGTRFSTHDYSLEKEEKSKPDIWHSGFLECCPRDRYLSHLTWEANGKLQCFGCLEATKTNKEEYLATAMR